MGKPSDYSGKLRGFLTLLVSQFAEDVWLELDRVFTVSESLPVLKAVVHTGVALDRYRECCQTKLSLSQGAGAVVICPMIQMMKLGFGELRSKLEFILLL